MAVTVRNMRPSVSSTFQPLTLLTSVLGPTEMSSFQYRRQMIRKFSIFGSLFETLAMEFNFAMST